MEGWGKIKPAAKYAGVSERLMRDWIKQGLKHSRLRTGTVLIRFSDIDAFLEQFAITSSLADQLVDDIMKESL